MKLFPTKTLKPFNNSDLDMYFSKLGVDRVEFESYLEADRFGALNRLYLAHIQTFPFQNFELRKLGAQHHFFREPLTLDLYRKLLSPSEVGGYCFQQSQLFYEVLRHYQFDVQRHLARVLNTMKVNSPEVFLLPASHLVLTVMLEGKKYFLDAGLPTRAPRLPLLIEPGEVVQHFDQMQMKIIPGDTPTYVFARKINGEFMDVVQTDLLPVDDKAVEFAMLKLTYFPGDIGIRDKAFLVSIITETGNKSIIFDMKAKKFAFTSEHEGKYSKSFIEDLSTVKKLLKDEFNITSVSEQDLQSFQVSKMTIPRRMWKYVDHALEPRELAVNLQRTVKISR